MKKIIKLGYRVLASVDGILIQSNYTDTQVYYSFETKTLGVSGEDIPAYDMEQITKLVGEIDK